MKTNENEQEIILQHKRRRRNHKIKLAVASAISLLISIILITTYFQLKKNEYNSYREKTEVGYRVKLKKNEFYENEYLTEGNSIIASLIENIETNFKYNLNLENDQEYIYSYRIIAKTNVKEEEGANSIYETTDEIVSKGQKIGTSKNLQIEENIVIDYNAYNNKINKFINIYDLDNTENKLELIMYVDIINKYDGKKINKESQVMSLEIPLTTKTIDISINSNVIENEGKILSKKSKYEDLTYMIVIGIILLLTGIIIFISLIKYTLDNRRAETMYRQELKKILFNYKSYIQQTNNEINLNNYKVIQINSFNEILAMRDTMQSPILMYTEENEERTKFMIINNDIIYIYILGTKEIRNELRIKSAMRRAKENNKT